MIRSCDSCRHFWQGVYNRPDPLGRTHCTLQPVWLEVKKGHFCSQHTAKNVIPAEINRYVTGDNTLTWVKVDEQRSRAIKAEKAAKELRAKIKAMKSGPADA